LYTAPVMVAVVAQPLLGERLTVARLVLALVVMAGAALTVTGSSHAHSGGGHASLAAGVAGGLLSAVSYAGTTVMARWAVPRYGVVKVLFYEAVGGVVLLAIVLPVAGHPPVPPGTASGWWYVGGLTLGTVLLANFCYFAGVRRIEAAPTSVAATIEPVVGALLALMLFSQELTPWGWLGLTMVVGGVAAGYRREALR
ncbi:MAG: DMT family transporter, partial [Gemmatimonadales bacterium]